MSFDFNFNFNLGRRKTPVQNAGKSFYLNFSEDEVDTFPEEMTKRFNTSNEYLVKADAEAEGGKVLQYNSPSGFDYHLVTVNEAILLNAVSHIRFKPVSGTEDMYLAFRMSGTGGSKNGYLLYMDDFFRELRLAYYNNDSFTLINSTSITAPTQGSWYELKAQIEGDQLKIKYWLSSNPEPESWDLEDTDSTISESGWTGIYNARANTTNIDWLSISPL